MEDAMLCALSQDLCYITVQYSCLRIILKNTCIILCLLPTLFIIQCTVFLFFNNYGIQYGSYGMLWYGMEGVREVCYCCNSFMYWYQYNMVDGSTSTTIHLYTHTLVLNGI